MRYCLHCGKLFVPAARHGLFTTGTGQKENAFPQRPSSAGKHDEMPPWLKSVGIIGIVFVVGATAGGGHSDWSWRGGLYMAAAAAYLLLARRYAVVAFLGVPVCFFLGIRFLMEGIKMGGAGGYGPVVAFFIFAYALLLLGLGVGLLVMALRKDKK